jgi:hypothetical protein
LVKVACPNCGAALRVDMGGQVVTCTYCRKSSFVHWPNRPEVPAPAMPDYGHIHVRAQAMRTAWMIVAVLVLAPVAIVVVIVVVIAVVMTATATAPPSPKVRMATPGGPACERAVACCKVIQPSNAACDGMRLMSEGDCSKQAMSLATAAAAMGKSCK